MGNTIFAENVLNTFFIKQEAQVDKRITPNDSTQETLHFSKTSTSQVY